MPGIYATQPKVHRNAVTTVDAADPADTSGAIDTKGYGECRFDITLSGTNFQSLEVQALFWNPRQSLWMGGGKRVFTAAGQHALAVESRGGLIYLKITAFSGASFNFSADYVLS
jgi:hypothetical protein